MACSIGPFVALISITVFGDGGFLGLTRPGGRILDDQMGNYSGLRNGNPDGYGWRDYSIALPLGANRTPDYYFPRYFASPPDQLFFPTYYNPYTTRGQRYLAYTNCGGDHPAGGRPGPGGTTPYNPYAGTINGSGLRPMPGFSGRVEATPISPGTSGLRP